MSDGLRESSLLFGLQRALKEFDPRRQPRTAAINLVEALHATLKLLELLHDRTGGVYVIKKKAKRTKAKVGAFHDSLVD